MEQTKEIPAAIQIAVERMRKAFGGTRVQLDGDVRRLEPDEWHPISDLGIDILMQPDIDFHSIGIEPRGVKVFLTNHLAEDIAWPPEEYGMMIAEEFVFQCLQHIYIELKDLAEKRKNETK